MDNMKKTKHGIISFVSFFARILIRLCVSFLCAVLIYKAFPASISPERLPNGCYVPKTLTYHSVLDETFSPYDYLFVRPSEFDRQLEILDSLGYEYLFAEEWQTTESPSVVITFDDGYLDNYTEMFPILRKHNAKATVFLIADLIDHPLYLSSAQIKEMSDSGLVSFQSHTMYHSILTELNEDELRAELELSCEKISSVTGKPVRSLAYPTGAHDKTVIEITKEYFTSAYTTDYPPRKKEYSVHTIPRYYVRRACPESEFLEILMRE